MTLHPRRRESDWCPVRAAIDILRDSSLITPQQMAALFAVTIKRHRLTAENFAIVVDELANQANEMADNGWFLMDRIAPHLEEVAGLLISVRSPDDERREQEDEQHQRELRQWAYERSM